MVSFGGTPAPVSDGEIAAIRKAVQSGLEVGPWPYLHVGHRVRIEDGPLAGVEGILVEIKSRRKLVVSVTLLQRSVAVELDGCRVFPAWESRRD